MSQQELLRRLVAALEGAAVPSMLSGSLVSSLQGEPRATHDIDIVIDVKVDDAARLADVLRAPDRYVDVNAVADAVRRRTMFNVVDPSSGDKADFWLLTDEPYDRERFSRRIRVEALGVSLFVSTPEDTILMKLRWANESGGSEKQFGDAVGVYEVQAGALDESYLDEWATKLGVEGLLAELRAAARPIDA